MYLNNAKEYFCTAYYFIIRKINEQKNPVLSVASYLKFIYGSLHLTKKIKTKMQITSSPHTQFLDVYRIEEKETTERKPNQINFI